MYGNMTQMDVLGTFPVEAMIIIGGFFAIMLVIELVCFILHAIGLHKVAKRRGIYHAWLAWIPIANQWVLGAISDQFQFLTREKKKAKRHLLLWLQILSIAFSICSSIFSAEFLLKPGYEILLPLLFGLYLGFAILNMILQALVYFDYFHSARPGSAVCYLILGLFIPCCMAIFVFADRKYDQSMPSLAQTESLE